MKDSLQIGGATGVGLDCTNQVLGGPERKEPLIKFQGPSLMFLPYIVFVK